MSEHLPLHDALDCAPPAMYVLQFQPSLLQLTTRVILSVTYLDCSSLWPRVRDRRREAPLSVRRWLAMILGQMVFGSRCCSQSSTFHVECSFRAAGQPPHPS